MLAVLTVAAQLAIVAHAPDTVFACDAIEVSVAVSAGGSTLPQVVAPSFRPFEVLRSSMRPRVDVTRTGGTRRGSVLVEYRYTLTTDRSGRFTIPPFDARLGEARALSRPLTIAVRPVRARGRSIVVARARIDTSTEADLRRVVPAETVFVGQQATYEVAVFLNQLARERLRRNPTFYPPEMQAVLAYDLPSAASSGPRGGSRGSRGSQCFDALVYRRALFPLIAGRLVIPPAQLVYSTALSSSSLFSREESHELQTDSVAVLAIDPPVEGRPVEYAGAVGDIRLESRLDSVVSRVGDPMLLTVRVVGSGNVKLFPRPSVGVPWAGLVPADERVRVDSTDARIGGVKEFDWVLTPRIAGEFDVPPVRYGYFDPAQRRYGIASTTERRIRVATGTLAADTAQAESSLSIRMRYGGTAWPPPQSRPAFWLVMVLAPLPALAARLRRRSAGRKQTASHDPMRALAIATAKDPVTLRRYFVRALAQRLGCNPEDFTHPGALQRALRRGGVSDGTATRAESLLRQLDAAAYAPTGVLPVNAARDASVLARAIDAEALARTELPFWIPALVLAISLGGVAHAIAADGAAAQFARGVSSYVRQDYVTARDAFADAVAQASTAPDAWANYGTASWSLADTAGAVLGWRQALAIEPNASDVRHHMALVRDDGPASPGWVPSLPRNASVWLFAIWWLGAWAVALIARRSTAYAWTARLPLPMAACALILGLGSIELETRISGTRLAVVRHAASLTSDPAIGMDRGPVLGTGEIVRVAGRRGMWTRVEAAEDRDGWIASSQLLLLGDHRAPRD